MPLEMMRYLILPIYWNMAWPIAFKLLDRNISTQLAHTTAIESTNLVMRLIRMARFHSLALGVTKYNICCILLNGHDGAQEVPNTGVTPVLAKDVGWVARTNDVDELKPAFRDDLSDLVVRQDVVPFVEFARRQRRRVNDALVVSKQIGSVFHRYTHIT